MRNLVIDTVLTEYLNQVNSMRKYYWRIALATTAFLICSDLVHSAQLSSWDFSQPTAYSYDSNKIEVTGGAAKLRQLNQNLCLDTTAEFSLGLFENTVLVLPSTITLAGPPYNNPGTYTSPVFDTGISSPTFYDITWLDSPQYLGNYPDYEGANNLISMSSNVFLLHMDNSWNDTSGSGFICISSNGATFSSSGKVGAYAAYFDGVDDVVKTTNTFLLHGAIDFTIEAWVYIESFSGKTERCIISHWDTDNSTRWGVLISSANKNIKMWISAAGWQSSNQNVISEGKWQYLAIVRSNNIITFYVDAVACGTVTNNNNISEDPAWPLSIGSFPSDPTTEPFFGKIDEIAIYYNRALSLSEIRERSRLNLRYQIRVSTIGSPSGDFIGIDGSSSSYYTKPDSGTINLTGRFFQYRAFLGTFDSSYTPMFSSITVSYSYYPEDRPLIINNTGQVYTNIFQFNPVFGNQNEGTISFQISRDKNNWYFFNGSSWTLATEYTQSNSSDTINSYISLFDNQIGTGTFHFRAIMQSDSKKQCEIDSVSISYNISPKNPENLTQVMPDQETVISSFAWINSMDFILRMNISDNDNPSDLRPCIEIKPVYENFASTENFSGAWYNDTGGLIVSTISVMGLSLNTSYHWQARVQDSDGDYSNWVAFGSNPEDIMDIGIDTTPASSIDIDTLIPHITSITVLGKTAYDTGSGLNPDPYYFEELTGNSGASDSLYTSSNAFIDAGLLPNTSYSYRVKVRNNAGIEAYSIAATTYTLSGPPTAGNISNLSTDSLKINWSSVNNNPSGTDYLIQKDSGTGYFNLNETIQENYFDINLLPNTAVSYKVKSQNYYGIFSDHIEMSTVTYANVPDNLFVKTISSVTLNLGFDPNNNSSSTVYFVKFIEIESGSTYYMQNSGNLGITTVYIDSATIDRTVISGLLPNRFYQISMSAKNSYGNETLFSSAISTCTYASSPVNPYISEVTTGSLRLSWSRGDNPANTEVYVEKDSGTEYFAFRITEGESIYDSGLLPNTSHNYRIKAKNNYGIFSEYIYFSTHTLARQPENSYIKDITSTTLRLGFDGKDNPSYTKYSVRFTDITSGATGYLQSGGGVGQSEVYITSAAVDLITVTGLRPNYRYIIGVQGKNEKGLVTGYAGMISTATRAAVPAGLYIVSLSSGDIRAGWLSNDNSPGTEYLCERVDTLINSGWTGDLFWEDAEGLLPDTTYTYRVKARNSFGIGTEYSGNISTKTYSGPLWAPVLTEPTTDSFKIRISTGNNPESTLYLIKALTGGVTYYVQAGGVLGGPEVFSRNSDWGEIELKGLAVNTKYELSVLPKNEYGIAGNYSAGQNMSTLARAPVNTGIFYAGISSITIIWEANSNPAGTEYYAKTVSTAAPPVDNSGWITALSWSSTGLSPNVEYKFIVKARNKDNTETIYSAEISTYTLTDTPGQAYIKEISSVTLRLSLDGKDNPAYTKYSARFTDITSGTTGYLQPGGGIGQSEVYITSAAVDLITVTGLQPNYRYIIGVRGKNENGVITDYGGTISTATRAAVPAGLYIVSLSSGDIRAGWLSNDNSPGTEYLCERVNTLFNSGWTGNLFWEDADGLLPDTTYTYRVKARNSFGIETGYSAGISTKTYPGPLGAPSLTGPTTYGFMIRISTGNNPESTLYLIRALAGGVTYYVQAGGALGGPEVFRRDIDWGEIELKGLAVNTKYELSVLPKNEYGIAGNYSAGQNMSTLARAPVNTGIFYAGISSITIIWEANSNPAGTEYYAKAVSTAAPPVDNSGWITASAWISTGLNPNFEYKFILKARNRDFTETVYSQEISTRTLASFPVNGAVTTKTDKAITLSWERNDSSPETEYFVYYSTYNFSGSDYSILPSSGWLKKNQVEIAGLVQNTSYYFYIAGRNSNQIETGKVFLLAEVTKYGENLSSDGKMKVEIISGAPPNSEVKISTAMSPGAKKKIDDSLLKIKANQSMKSIDSIPVYDIKLVDASGQPLVFSGAAKIKISYAHLVTGRDKYLKIFRFDESLLKWRLLPTEMDAAAKEVHTTVASFSIYTAMYYLAPAGVLDAARNYPNPFNPVSQKTTIVYLLTKDCRVTLRIFNSVGDLVRNLEFDSGTEGGKGWAEGYMNVVEWDGRNGTGMLCANGGYICQITAEPADEKGKKYTQVRKIAILK